ncbi:MAG: uncharacterized protein KVP18_002845 [Porospora cf. gigantea A]|uniref:uncharacterized protein n=1 Tax=Porospora cf. gigantea A TaxID=2853593 RepID=UPI00355A2FC1|nr:MAG: hypothetical protein KVP18_002845 [Porospora cf. gigantea A]
MVEADSQFTFDLLKDICACDLQLNSEEAYQFYYKNQKVSMCTTLELAGVEDKDLVLLRRARPAAAPSSKSAQRDEFVASQLAIIAGRRGLPQTTMFDEETETLLARAAANPNTLTSLRMTEPGIARALENGKEAVRDALKAKMVADLHAAFDDDWALREAHQNPDTSESQRVILAHINRNKVAEQRAMAMEYMPELYTSVSMLYVHCKLNKKPVVAFIDSGAQISLLSQRFALENGLEDLIDRQYQGVATGVGIGKIVGRIHLCDLQLGSKHLQVSFSVIEGDLDFLLGLDLMKRYHMVLDLGKHALVLDGEPVPFLSEAESAKRGNP